MVLHNIILYNIVGRFASKRQISDSDSFHVAINNSTSTGGVGMRIHMGCNKKKKCKKENKKSQLWWTRTRPSRIHGCGRSPVDSPMQ